MSEFIHDIIIGPEIKPRIPGYLLVETDLKNPSQSTRVLMEGIRRFFGGFGRNAHLFDLGSHKFAMLLPDTSQKLDCISFKKEGMDFAFLEGTFYDFDLLRSWKDNSKLIGEQLAGELIDIVKKGNHEQLKQLNGRYSGFVYIAESKSLFLITDQYGANRFFVYDNGKQMAVSNNVLSLATNPHLHISINEQSISQILQMEYPVSRATEFTEISLVLPSDIYIRQNKQVRYIKFYQKLNRTRTKSNQLYVRDLQDTINDFFKRFYQYTDETTGLYLSKGKDSRLFLSFLEENRIPYLPFVFKDGTGVLDYPEVKRIAGLLEKDLHVLESYQVDRRLAFMTAMSTTPTMSWFALGSVAKDFTNTALMGYWGDASSGKMPSFRTYGIKTKDQAIEAFFEIMISKGVTQEGFRNALPYYDKFNNWESYRGLFKDLPNTELLYDNELLHDIDYKTFRNALPILLRAQHFVTPVTPYIEQSVASVYRSLPENLLNSQKAHTLIAALETRTNTIRSTAFPISLKTESRFRPAMIELIKLNHKFNNLFLKWQIREFNPYVAGNEFNPRSDYFKGVFQGNTPAKVDHKRLLKRLHNTDDYLHLIFHDNILPLCYMPVIVYNDFAQNGK